MLARFKSIFTRRFVAALAAAVVVTGAAAGWKLGSGEAIGRYMTAPVSQTTIEENVTALGTLQPLQYVDVGTQVTGQLKKLHVDIGAQVKKGDLLAEVDSTLIEAKVNGTRATIKSLKAQAAERRANLELAAAQQKRARTLFDANAGSADALEQAAAAEKTAAAQVDSLQAQIEQTESTLKADEANLRYTRIYAPMAGTIVTLTAREGQTLVSSQQAPVILRIADLKTMTVQTQVSEADVPRIKVGMPVYFTTLGQPNRRWQGTARQVLPTPEVINNVVLFNVLFDVENPDGALKPQMSAQTFFVIARADNVLAVPVAALQQTGNANRARRPREEKAAEASSEEAKAARPQRAAGERRNRGDDAAVRPRNYVVRVVNGEGKVEERPITVGVMNRIQAQVLSGLTEGEAVIIGTTEPEKKAASPSKGGAMRARI